jgi:hypothetical protein
LGGQSGLSGLGGQGFAGQQGQQQAAYSMFPQVVQQQRMNPLGSQPVPGSAQAGRRRGESNASTTGGVRKVSSSGSQQ